MLSLGNNIDHNPSSRTAKDSWHGTAISASQHLENKDDGCVRPSLELQNDKIQSKTLKQLPTEYTSISPYVLKKKDIIAPCDDETSKEVEYFHYFITGKRCMVYKHWKCVLTKIHVFLCLL